MADLSTTGLQFYRTAQVLDGARLGETITSSKTLSANNTTAAVPIFGVVGAVKITALYGIVTTTIGSNHTAAHWRLNDQTATVAISLATGTTVSSLSVGTTLVRRSIASIALAVTGAGAGAVIDPVAATAPDVFMPFIVSQKVGGVQTDIEYVYTTTNAPTTGAITFYATYVPLTADSTLTAV